jgi:hypothetical protein
MRLLVLEEAEELMLWLCSTASCSLMDYQTMTDSLLMKILKIPKTNHLELMVPNTIRLEQPILDEILRLDLRKGP